MTKIVSYDIFAIIIAVKHKKNPCEVSTAVRKNPCEPKNSSKLSRKLRES